MKNMERREKRHRDLSTTSYGFQRQGSSWWALVSCPPAGRPAVCSFRGLQGGEPPGWARACWWSGMGPQSLILLLLAPCAQRAVVSAVTGKACVLGLIGRQSGQGIYVLRASLSTKRKRLPYLP